MSSGPARKWYSSARWQRRRADQLAGNPLCWMCLRDGIVTVAVVADHDPPHRNDYDKFWNGPLRSLCKRHHDSDAQRRDAGRKPRVAIGKDGWPVQE